jgi:2-polyprenyl-3-methyl-5-hydroxy-6-metoxy-1,4-benzoquinol methylase
MNFYDVGYCSEGITNTSKKYMMKCVKFLRKTYSMKMLHVGCGEGYYVRQAIDEGIDAYGIDISRRALWQSSLRHCHDLIRQHDPML